MAKFVLLYNGGSMPETEEDQAAVMKAWMDWYGRLGSAVVDAGNPFSAMAKHIAGDGTVSDRPAGEMAAGYSIIQADTLDAAVEMAKGCPLHLHDGGEMTVFETFPAM